MHLKIIKNNMFSGAASLGVWTARCPMLGLPVLMNHMVAALCRTQRENATFPHSVGSGHPM